MGDFMRLRQKLQLTILLAVLGWASSFTGLIGRAESSRRVGRTEYSVQEATSAGRELESSRKWIEAIEHYEQAVKDWPSSEKLKLGLRRSKFQFKIERRYSDKSFRNSMLRLTERDALQVYDELVGKIQYNYVDRIGPTSIVAHGTESLYLALGNSRFLETNLHGGYASDRNGEEERIRRMRRMLRTQYWNKSVAHLGEARSLILQICRTASAELGLRSGPVIMEYVFGACNALDDYSSFLTPGRLKDLYGNIDGEFVGLGIEMKAELGEGLLLVSVLPDSPADQGGLMPGDHIVAIDGVDCRNMTTDEGADRLQGLAQTQVRLEIQGPPGTRTRYGTFTRRPVVVKSFPVVKMVDRDNGIGYIQMTGFQRNSTAELDAALQSLHRQGMRALIWDVRGNPGGLLETSVEVLDRFIDQGVLVSTRGRHSQDTQERRAKSPGTWRMPLVLLIDGNSASASEIVAGAIRDHKRGTLVGRKTYGKWSVQSILESRSQTGLKTGLRLTTAKFYSPNGRNYAKVGVSPDIDVPKPDHRMTYFRSPTDLNVEGDEDLKAGLRILRRQMARR